MPNDVTTRCTVTGPATDIAKFREQVFSVQNEETYLDFEKIIPSPPIVGQVEESTISKEAAALILARADGPVSDYLTSLSEFLVERTGKELNMPNDSVGAVATAYFAKYPEIEAQGRLRLQAILETGYQSWYSWNIENWGTDSNTYNCEVISEEPLLFIFDTAVYFPKRIFVKLVETFPTFHFKCVTFSASEYFAGYFNPPEGEAEWKLCEATVELCEQVFYKMPDREQADA